MVSKQEGKGGLPDSHVKRADLLTPEARERLIEQQRGTHKPLHWSAVNLNRLLRMGRLEAVTYGDDVVVKIDLPKPELG